MDFVRKQQRLGSWNVKTVLQMWPVPFKVNQVRFPFQFLMMHSFLDFCKGQSWNGIFDFFPPTPFNIWNYINLNPYRTLILASTSLYSFSKADLVHLFHNNGVIFDCHFVEYFLCWKNNLYFKQMKSKEHNVCVYLSIIHVFKDNSCIATPL